MVSLGHLGQSRSYRGIDTSLFKEGLEQQCQLLGRGRFDVVLVEPHQLLSIECRGRLVDCPNIEQ